MAETPKITTLDKIVLAASVAMILDVILLQGTLGKPVVEKLLANQSYINDIFSDRNEFYKNIEGAASEILGAYYMIRRSYVGNRE